MKHRSIQTGSTSTKCVSVCVCGFQSYQRPKSDDLEDWFHEEEGGKHDVEVLQDFIVCCRCVVELEKQSWVHCWACRKCHCWKQVNYNQPKILTQDFCFGFSFHFVPLFCARKRLTLRVQQNGKCGLEIVGRYGSTSAVSSASW